MTLQMTIPAAVLDMRYSTPRAEPVRWIDARAMLEDAEVYWLATVRENGQPHIVPLLMVLVDESLCFCTGPEEQKTRNLAINHRVTITTGSNQYRSGTDIVIEGEAQAVLDGPTLGRIAERFMSKYEWSYQVTEGGFAREAGSPALVFRVPFAKGYAFARGDEFGQTRWSFGSQGRNG